MHRTDTTPVEHFRMHQEHHCPYWRRAYRITIVFLLLVILAMSMTSCVSTKPLDARVLPDGTRTGSSKQVVFLCGYQSPEAVAVAMDYANLKAVQSVDVKRRVRAFGTAFITTVQGHE